MPHNWRRTPVQATVLEKERNWEVQRENETHVHGMRTSVICAHVRRARTNMALCCCEILSDPPTLTAIQVSWMKLTKSPSPSPSNLPPVQVPRPVLMQRDGGNVAWVVAKTLRGVLLVLVVSPASTSEAANQRGVEPGAPGAFALLARHGEKDEDNIADIDLNQKGRIRAAAMAALLWPSGPTSRRLYNGPLPECLRGSYPVALAAQVPGGGKAVRRCLETAEVLAAEAQKQVQGLKIAKFEMDELDPLVHWIKAQAHDPKGQQDSVSVTVWDHTYIKQIVDKLLGTTESPNWPGDRYDVWWLVDLNRGLLWQFSHELLFGDQKAAGPQLLLSVHAGRSGGDQWRRANEAKASAPQPTVL